MMKKIFLSGKPPTGQKLLNAFLISSLNLQCQLKTKPQLSKTIEKHLFSNSHGKDAPTPWFWKGVPMP